MIDIIVEASAAVNLAIVAAVINTNGSFNWVAGKICPAVLSLLLGVHAYGKIMGWPV